MGFVEFVEAQKKVGHERLFPEETRNANGSFDAFSKRFNRYKRAVGVISERKAKKDFHSFRHVVSWTLFGVGVQEGIVNDILGHGSAQRSESRRTYAEGAFLKVKAECIEKLRYDLPFSKIGTWRPSGQ